MPWIEAPGPLTAISTIGRRLGDDPGVLSSFAGTPGYQTYPQIGPYSYRGHGVPPYNNVPPNWATPGVSGFRLRRVGQGLADIGDGLSLPDVSQVTDYSGGISSPPTDSILPVMASTDPGLAAMSNTPSADNPSVNVLGTPLGTIPSSMAGTTTGTPVTPDSSGITGADVAKIATTSVQVAATGASAALPYLAATGALTPAAAAAILGQRQPTVVAPAAAPGLLSSLQSSPYGVPLAIGAAALGVYALAGGLGERPLRRIGSLGDAMPSGFPDPDCYAASEPARLSTCASECASFGGTWVVNPPPRGNACIMPAGTAPGANTQVATASNGVPVNQYGLPLGITPTTATQAPTAILPSMVPDGTPCLMPDGSQGSSSGGQCVQASMLGGYALPLAVGAAAVGGYLLFGGLGDAAAPTFTDLQALAGQVLAAAQAAPNGGASILARPTNFTTPGFGTVGGLATQITKLNAQAIPSQFYAQDQQVLQTALTDLQSATQTGVTPGNKSLSDIRGLIQSVKTVLTQIGADQASEANAILSRRTAYGFDVKSVMSYWLQNNAQGDPDTDYAFLSQAGSDLQNLLTAPPTPIVAPVPPPTSTAISTGGTSPFTLPVGSMPTGQAPAAATGFFASTITLPLLGTVPAWQVGAGVLLIVGAFVLAGRKKRRAAAPPAVVTAPVTAKNPRYFVRRRSA